MFSVQKCISVPNWWTRCQCQMLLSLMHTLCSWDFCVTRYSMFNNRLDLQHWSLKNQYLACVSKINQDTLLGGIFGSLWWIWLRFSLNLTWNYTTFKGFLWRNDETAWGRLFWLFARASSLSLVWCLFVWATLALVQSVVKHTVTSDHMSCLFVEKV